MFLGACHKHFDADPVVFKSANFPWQKAPSFKAATCQIPQLDTVVSQSRRLIAKTALSCFLFLWPSGISLHPSSLCRFASLSLSPAVISPHFLCRSLPLLLPPLNLLPNSLAGPPPSVVLSCFPLRLFLLCQACPTSGYLHFSVCVRV